ncbi:hypothetical protein GCM10023350_14170 [Nocardioides endophyticus]|uniref:DUF4352 domain-containing protein n=2 Tax=Nocardioides endophyticus TaxID=1353775 RepID=A0ABP8YJE6_9ACTN
MPTTRRRAILVGLLVGLPVALFGALLAVWGLADRYRPMGGTAWSTSHPHQPHVAWGTSVKISGTTRKPLRPGVSSRVRLGFTNQGLKAVSLRHVRVTISSITAPQASPEYPCTRADFRVRPMRARPFVVPDDGFTNLVRLGVPGWQWPRLTMRNRPVNQDGCKGASLKLSYRGYRAWSG